MYNWASQLSGRCGVWLLRRPVNMSRRVCAVKHRCGMGQAGRGHGHLGTAARSGRHGGRLPALLPAAAAAAAGGSDAGPILDVHALHEAVPDIGALVRLQVHVDQARHHLLQQRAVGGEGRGERGEVRGAGGEGGGRRAR